MADEKPWQWYMPEGKTPWGHQIEVFEWAKDRMQAALFLEMGLGKTYTAINLMQRHLDLGHIEVVLVVSLLSSLDSVWMEALTECKVPGAAVNVAEREAKAARLKALQTPAQWYVMNYDSVTTLQDDMAKVIKAHHGRVGIVADETSMIKTPTTARCKALCNLRKLQDYRIIMNGSPLAQGPMDIFGQYKFLDPTIFGPLIGPFKTHFMMMGGYMGRQVLGLYKDREAEFNKAMYSVAIRRTKAECTDLPPKVYTKRVFELNPEERALYDQMSHHWVMLVRDRVVAAQQGIVRSLRLAQLTTGFYHEDADREDGAPLWQVNTPSKLLALQSLIEELPPNSKFIIWCAWRKNVEDVMAWLKAHGITAVDYYGGTEGGQQQKTANELAFRHDPKVRAFVGTGASGCASLNLQGPQVQTVIYYSQRYSNYQRQQSEDRPHRGDIKHTVTVVDLIAKGTVEVSIVAALRAGKDLQNYLLQSPEKFVRGAIDLEEQHERPATQGA